MRRFVFLVTCCFIFALSGTLFAQTKQKNSSNTQQYTIHWYTDYDQAMQMAKKEHKPVLLLFTGSDWCGWCKKLDSEVFSTKEFAQEAANKFVFVEVDFPMKKPLDEKLKRQNNQLKQKYGVTGYPSVVLLDANGNFVAETGYMPGGGKAYYQHLQQLMR